MGNFGNFWEIVGFCGVFVSFFFEILDFWNFRFWIENLELLNLEFGTFEF